MSSKPKRQKGKLWTLDEHETALKMDLDGYSQYEIAKRIGRTRASVQSRMRTLDYMMDKEAIIHKALMNTSFEVGATYLISEKDPPICIKFLPGKFIYEGKTQGSKAKHIFKSLNCNYLLTFTDVQLHGYTFQKEGDGNAKGLREDEKCYQEEDVKERCFSCESRQGSQAHSCCDVEQKTSKESSNW